jgi:hypothetical protein
MKSLKDLYQTHSGKVLDKWTIYLEEYEKKLNNTDITILNQSSNPWSNNVCFLKRS